MSRFCKKYFTNRIVETVLRLPKDPLVIKTSIFFLSEIGSEFLRLPSLFPPSLEYILAHGLLPHENINCPLHLASNAIEGLFNLTCECEALFTPGIILPMLNACEPLLSLLHSALADRLVESLLNAAIKLETGQFVASAQRLLGGVFTELSTQKNRDSDELKDIFVKSVNILTAAFTALGNVDSNIIHNAFGEGLGALLPIVMRDTALYHQWPELLISVVALCKKIIHALSVHSV